MTKFLILFGGNGFSFKSVLEYWSTNGKIDGLGTPRFPNQRAPNHQFTSIAELELI